MSTGKSKWQLLTGFSSEKVNRTNVLQQINVFLEIYFLFSPFCSVQKTFLLNGTEVFVEN